MANYSYGGDPSHFVEVPDDSAPGQTKRPAAGAPVIVQDAATFGAVSGLTDPGGNPITSVVTLAYGYLGFVCTSPAVRVSADSGVSFKRLVGVEALDAAVAAGPTASAAANTANAALNTANLALSKVQVYVIYETGGSYPLRATATSDDNAMVRWCGPDAPPIGAGYATGHDRWEQET